MNIGICCFDNTILKMEKSDNSTWLAHQVEVFLRTVVLLFNATLWLLVLYFSIHDDEKAAVLSYVSVTLTILTVKYYLWEVINDINSVAYFIDCSSKGLILAGIFLVLLPEFWNTTFYSVCLGIIIQTAKREIQIRGRNEILHLCMLVSEEEAKTETTDEIRLQNEAHEVQISENKMNNLSGDNGSTPVSLIETYFSFKNTIEEQNIQMKQCEENIKEEIQSFHKKLNKCHLNASEIVGKYIVVSCSKENKLGDPEESKNSVHDRNSQRGTVSMEAVESTLKRMEYITQSNVVSNYGETEKVQNTEKLCTLQIKLLNLQELKSSECYKLESKYDLNKNNIERELKRNEEASVNMSMKHGALNNENLDFSNDDAKKLETTDNSTETITEPRNNVKDEFYLRQVNFCSNVYPDNSENFNQTNDLISSYSAKNSFQTNQNEGECKIDEEPVHISQFIKDNENLLSLNNDSMLDTTSQHKENTCKLNSQKVYTDLQEENSPEKNVNSNSEPRYEIMKCISEKTKNIHPEREKSAYQMYMPEKCNDGSTNLNASLQHKERIDDVVCSTNFETNREKNLMNETDLQKNSFEINKNFKHSNMTCTAVKATDIQSVKDITERKIISQQVNDGNLEAVLGENDKVLFESKYSFEPKCLSSSKVLDDNSSKLNESADVEETTYINQSVKDSEDDEDETRFPDVSNVDDVVNRIDLSFIYALGFNVPRAE